MTGAGQEVAFFQALSGTRLSSQRFQRSVLSLSWTPDKEMQAASAVGRQAIVWETTHYEPLASFTRHTTPILSLSFGSDGTTVASASSGGGVRVWNTESLEEIHGFYQDSVLPIRACAFAPAGPQLAVGGDDGVIRLWKNGFVCEAEQGLLCQDKPLHLKAGDAPVLALAWSPDARYLASGSQDGSCLVWSPQQTPLFRVSMPHAVESLAWSRGGQLAGASGNTVTIWRVL
jgi:WD40 repeat protein